MNPNLIGGIEIGTSLAVILLGMATVQVYVYYVNFPHDSRVIKTLIAVIWLTELAHVVGTCYALYRITISQYGSLGLQPLPLELCTTAILGSALHPVVQSIFAARLYQLGGPRPHARVVAAVCWALAGFVLGTTVLAAIKVLEASSVDGFASEWGWLVVGLLGATAVVDVLIAGAMCLYNVKLRKHHEDPNAIDVLISWTAQTGLFTSISAVAVVVFFALNKNTHIWLTLLIFSTGLYSNSLLSLLNGRLQLGYQMETPFVISLETFRNHNEPTAQLTYPPNPSSVQLAYPPTPKLPSLQFSERDRSSAGLLS